MSISSKKLKFSVSVEGFKDLFHIPIQLVEYSKQRSNFNIFVKTR